MTEGVARVGGDGIELAFDVRGPRKGPVILLIMGLGTQLTAWPEPFCDALAAAGFRVIRFDNRDVGLSTKIEGGRRIDLHMAIARSLWGMPVGAPYTLRDMAGDAVGLLDALGIGAAHIVGASMGGMIAQIVAAEYPDRSLSLVSIMSTSGSPSLPQPRRDAFSAVMSPRPDIADRERAIAHAMQVYRTIGGRSFPVADEELRARVTRTIDRSYYPQGIARQFLAILASGSNVALLRRIRVPTLVVHGSDDPLVPLEAGRHTAELVAGATLRVIEGMGHDLAPGVLPILAHELAEHCRDARTVGLVASV